MTVTTGLPLSLDRDGGSRVSHNGTMCLTGHPGGLPATIDQPKDYIVYRVSAQIVRAKRLGSLGKTVPDSIVKTVEMK